MPNYYFARPHPRWFKVIATRSINSENMQYSASVEIDIFANDATDAMKKLRADFRFWHLAVQP